jgi:UDP-glucose 4-epimerase
MVVGDVGDSDLLKEYISSADVVYHMAAIADIAEASVDPVHTMQQNIMGSVNVIDSCARHSVRLMYGSTVYVYSKHGAFYRVSKQAVENIIETYADEMGLDYTILRYGSLYGPRSQQWNGLNRIVTEMVGNERIVFGGTGDERREYIHVKDAARMSVDVLSEKYIRKAVMLTGTQVLTSTELLSMIREVLQKDIDIKFDASSSSHNHYTMTPYQYIPKSAVKIISEECVDIGQGILELIDAVYHAEQSGGDNND